MLHPTPSAFFIYQMLQQQLNLNLNENLCQPCLRTLIICVCG